MCLCGHTDADHKMGKGPCKLCDRFGCDSFTAADDDPQDAPAVEVVVEPAPTEENIDTIADLLDAAVRSQAPKMVKAAEKIRADIADLQDRLAEWSRDARLRGQLAAAEAKVAEIREQMKARPVSPARVESRAVRAWAEATGVDCPKVGRVPAAVLAAYEADNR
jgi:hypothetical protein